jgi:hypothetical protein
MARKSSAETASMGPRYSGNVVRALGTATLLACTACGRFAFGPIDDERGDARNGDGNGDLADTAADAEVVTAACEAAWLAGPNVSAPTRIVALTSASTEYTPFLSNDGLDLYFASDRVTDFDIYRARRTTITSAFGMPQPVTDVNTMFVESQLTLSRNGLEALLGSNRGGQHDIFRATRAVDTDPFGTFSLITAIATNADEYNATLGNDELRLYFAADTRSGGLGLYDLWYADRIARDQPFGTAVLDPLSTAATEASPTLIATERVMVFTSDRTGGSGALDLWYATRTDTALPFGTPKPVPAVNGAIEDFTPFLRPDGCELFFASFRTGNNEIYVSQITP